MTSQTAAQLALPDQRSRGSRSSRSSRYDTVSDNEAAATGRALIAQLRGEALSVSQEALLTCAQSDQVADERAPTPVIDASDTLLTLARGQDAEVRVSWRRYKGSSPFLDVRRFERRPGRSGEARGERGELRPTRQGVTIRGHELSKLLTTLVKLQARGESEREDG